MNGEFRNPKEHSKIEAQLKRLRPIAPRLDLEVIVREARQAPGSVSLAPRAAHRYGVIGLSWISGALAGAVLMYVGLAKPWTATPGNDPASIAENNSVPTVEREIAASADADAGVAPLEVLQEPQAAPAPMRQAAPPNGAALALFALSDPRSSLPVSALRAGAHLTGLGKEANEAAAAEGLRPFEGEANLPHARRLELPPSPEITRGELMRQLRDADSHFAL